MPWQDTAGRTIRATCPAGHIRHWFTMYGYPGIRTPTCQRCKAPNPRPLTDEEQREYDAVLAQRRQRYGVGA